MIGPEIVAFSKVVSDVFDLAELTTLLLSMNRRLVDYVTAANTYPKQVEELVGTANSQGWISQFVVKVIRDRGDVSGIRTFLTNYPDWDPARSYPLDHPSDALQVFGGKCFIGRSELRQSLKEMNTRTGKKVLRVTSDHRKVGKTYSKELVDFLATNLPPSAVAEVDLDRDDYDPPKLAFKLGKAMGIDVTTLPERAHEQAARLNQELVDWLIPQTPNPAPMAAWWIVLDGFFQKPPTEAIQDFISQLAQRVQRTERFRLVLLNYKYHLPLSVGAFVLTDKVKRLDRSEVETFLSNIHERKFREKPTPELLSEYVNGVYERVARYAQENPDSAEDQLLLNIAVSEAIKTI